MSTTTLALVQWDYPVLRVDDDGPYLDDDWRKVGKVHALRDDADRTLCGLIPGGDPEYFDGPAVAVTCGRCRRSRHWL